MNAEPRPSDHATCADCGAGEDVHVVAGEALCVECYAARGACCAGEE